MYLINFKKTLYITLAVLGFCACKTSDQYLQEDQPDEGVLLEIEAEKDNEAATKIAYINNTVVWTANDAIGIYAVRNNGLTQQNKKYTLQNADIGKRFGKFTANNTRWNRGTYNFYFYYPYSADNAHSINDIDISIPRRQQQSQANNSDHIRAYKYLRATLPNITLTQTQRTNNLSLVGDSKLQNLTATFRFIVSELAANERITSITLTSSNGAALAYDGTLDLQEESDPITISKGYASIVLSIGGSGNNVGLGNGDTATMVVRNLGPATAGTTQSFMITFETNEHKTYVRKSTSGNITSWELPNGARSNVIQNVDLVASHYKIAGETSYAPDGTKILDYEGHANCYIVKPNGKYKFNAGYEGASDDPLSITGATLDAVWGSDLITLIGLGNKGDINFSTGSQTGNALISLTKNGQIIWSWHIWITEDIGEIEAVGSNGDGGTFMDRNLGALSANPSGSSTDAICGLFYQWGRKDPFHRESIASNKRNTSGQSNYNNNRQNATTLLATSIQHPDHFFSYWTGSEAATFTRNRATYDQSWASYSSSDNPLGSAAPGKTKYDPCPFGWRVPTNNELSYFTTANFDRYQYDASYFDNGLVIPDSGLISEDGTYDWQSQSGSSPHHGYLWTSTSAANTYNKAFNLIVGSIPNNNPAWRVYGYGKTSPDNGEESNYNKSTARAQPVRCIKIPE